MSDRNDGKARFLFNQKPKLHRQRLPALMAAQQRYAARSGAGPNATVALTDVAAVGVAQTLRVDGRPMRAIH